MRTKFQEQLDILNKDLMNMGALIEKSIEDAVDALMKKDIDKAKKVMDGDTVIDNEEKKIHNICFNILMQQQPVAKDLRLVSAAMKMVTDMERIGDHASDISEITIFLAKKPLDGRAKHIDRMATETVKMLIESIEAFIDKDIEKARSVIKNDDIIDSLFLKTKQDVIDMISDNRNSGEVATDILMIAKYFERIGDHATNIAEWVIYAYSDTAEEI
ncbi:phosphate transport system protein [Lachnospiraceae bacterium C7]|nr:phosphate transport system protein [Lachnospiraceae bacterium C7]